MAGWERKDTVNIIIALATGALFATQDDKTRPLAIGAIAVSSVSFAFLGYSRWRESWPRILTKPKDARNAASSIYERAARDGGALKASHVFPRSNTMEGDIACNLLQGAVLPVTFERLLIVDNRYQEEEWVRATFRTLSPNPRVAITLRLLSAYPLVFPRLVKALIPRINILLYSHDNHREVLVGVDRFPKDADLGAAAVARTDGLESHGFAVHLRSSRAYSAVEKYYSTLTDFAGLFEARSLGEYEANKRDDPLRPGVRDAIERIVAKAESCPDILFVGVFGSVGKVVTGVFPDAVNNERDLDVDFLIVCAQPTDSHRHENLRTEIAEQLPSDTFSVVWGDNDRYFYEWRVQGRVNVDIEIVTKDSTFYAEHLLLGGSVLRYLVPLYASTGATISSLIKVESSPLGAVDRWKLVLDDRKGLMEFHKWLSEDRDTVDHRRVCSLVLRNVTWADAGHQPATSDRAIRYLASRWKEFFPKSSKKKVQDLLDCKQDHAKGRNDAHRLITLQLIDDAIASAKRALPPATE